MKWPPQLLAIDRERVSMSIDEQRGKLEKDKNHDEKERICFMQNWRCPRGGKNNFLTKKGDQNCLMELITMIEYVSSWISLKVF